MDRPNTRALSYSLALAAKPVNQVAFVLRLGREAALPQKYVLVHLRLVLVTDGDFRLAFDCQRHQLAEVYVVSQQMVEHFPSLKVNAEPESNQQVELELLGPSFATLKCAYAFNGTLLIADEDLPEGLLRHVGWRDHLVNDLALFHVDEDGDLD